MMTEPRVNRTGQKLEELGGWAKLALMVAFDALALPFALWLSFCIRLGEAYWPADARILMLAGGAVFAALCAFFPFGAYRIVIRYLDIRAAPRLAGAAAVAAALWYILTYLSRLDLPRSVGFIYFGLAYLFMFYGRMAASALLSSAAPRIPRRKADRPAEDQPVGVVIYGANAAGHSLAVSIRRQPRYKLRFFVDDDPAFRRRTLAGLPIRPVAALGEAVAAGQVSHVFLAMPQASRAERLAAMASLSGLAVQVLTVPSHDEILRGRVTISDVRPLHVEELLKRDVVPPVPELVREGIAGRTILITGAGGSIGSEICRQVVEAKPARLILLDHSEYALYAVERELRRNLASAGETMPELIPVIGSLLNEKLLARTLNRWRVHTVFHAAAYKHVPLLENNEVVGVENNVMGTKILADACIAAEVGRLTMISTDKAVRPTNVMGASKRVAELYIQALAREQGETRFGIVRFGNVLDSSGSVVQQFRAQIRDGGPVTVTHPDITRFFMSIPEATQLVLQASAMAEGGEVFVLDMGEPVRIVDLARTMIQLSGMTERTTARPDGDVEITFVGLRPGEKLHEELFVGEQIGPTAHPQIRQAREPAASLLDLEWRLHRLQAAIRDQDASAVRATVTDLLAIDGRQAA